jgi:penicillin-binding protein 2
MAKRFGLGQDYEGLSLPPQRDGLVPTPEWKRRRYDAEWLTGETLNTAIGQGYLLTSPLQLAVMSARIASGRTIVPRLVGGGPAPGSIDVDPEHLARVRHAMGLTVNGPQGTAGRSRLPIPIQMAGKTGTAQVRALTSATRGANFHSIPWKYRDHGHFIAFAPVEEPRYAISVVVEHGGGGSIAAAPIAKDVMTFLFAPDVAMAALEKLEEGWGRAAAQREAVAAAAAAAQAASTPAASEPIPDA